MPEIKNLYTEKVTAIKGQRIAIENKLRPATLIIGDGVIRSIEPYDFETPSESTINTNELVVFPGLIDPHVHLNEPGHTDWEGFETGTRAAAAGGITTLFDMPLNSVPVTTDKAGLFAKKKASANKLKINVGFHGGFFDGNEEGLSELLESGIKTIKVFLIDSGLAEFPPTSIEALRKAAPILKKANATLLVHSEFESGRTQADRDIAASAMNTIDWEKSRPPAMEVNAVKAMIDLCRETNLSIHIVHVATKEALPLIKAAKNEGLPITAETCPHYLFYDSTVASYYDGLLKCAPPIRSAEDRDALCLALLDGTLDFVATDHSPSPPEMKMPNCSFSESWGGVSSLQFLLPATWRCLKELNKDSVCLLPLLCEGPAKLLGLDHRKGKIAEGYDADLTIWDPNRTFAGDSIRWYHRHPLNGYAKYLLCGTVEATLLNGDVIYNAGKFNDENSGKILTSN